MEYWELLLYISVSWQIINFFLTFNIFYSQDYKTKKKYFQWEWILLAGQIVLELGLLSFVGCSDKALSRIYLRRILALDPTGKIV